MQIQALYNADKAILRGKVYIKEQETSGNYKFEGILTCMTRGFKNIFEDEAILIAGIALKLITEKYPDNADYFQTFEYHYNDGKIVKFWCINDVDHITFLLPEEY